MSYMERRNAATFAKCQANYDNMQHPDYYAEDPPPCDICGDDSDTLDEDGIPICNQCEKEWYNCPECGAVYWHRAEHKNELCDDCKAEGAEVGQ